MKSLSRIAAVMVAAGLLSACAGRAANPVMVQQYGDNSKSCAALEHDMAFVESEIQRLVPQTEKTGKNTALGITGFFLIVPLFFMDMSQSEQIEVNAFRQRYNHLYMVAQDKGCESQRQPMPELKKPETTEKDTGAQPGV